MELALLGSNVSTEVLSAIIYVYSFSHLNKELISSPKPCQPNRLITLNFMLGLFYCDRDEFDNFF